MDVRRFAPLLLLLTALAVSPRASGQTATNTASAHDIALSNLLRTGYLSATNRPPTNPPPKSAKPASSQPVAPIAAATNAPVATTNSVDLLDDKYRLVIGDQLSFRIVEDEEDPIILAVTDSGEIQVPYLGRYPATGKTSKELALALKAELEKKYYYQATVVIAVNSKPRSRGKIYLVGAIRVPGPQEIGSDEKLTISKAILRAGGFSDFANEKKVQLTRGETSGKTIIIVDVSRIFEKGDTQNDLSLEPGDLIYIPERLVRF
jgi:polysaccharide export outer membrane protein